MKRLLYKIRHTTFFKRKWRSIRCKAEEMWLSALPCKMLVDKNADYDHEMIVSLTSYPARFPTLHIALKAIMYQTMRPNRVVLYLDEGVEREKIPESLAKLEKYGLEIVNRPYNLKCHKKYLHAITENPEAIVITVDDDVMYHRRSIEELYMAHTKNPDCICAKRVHRIVLDKDGNPVTYDDWDWLCTSIKYPSSMVLITGFGSVLYPPHSLRKETFDVKLIPELALGQDDIWLTFQAYLSGTKVVWAPTKHIEPDIIYSSQTTGLFMDNVDDFANDRCVRRLTDYYQVDWKKIQASEQNG